MVDTLIIIGGIILVLIIVVGTGICMFLGDKHEDNRTKRKKVAEAAYQESIKYGLNINEFGEMNGLDYHGQKVDRDGNQT